MRFSPRFLVLCAIVATSTQAQTIPVKGADATFEVASWNVKWFGNTSQGPSNETLQRQNVAAVISGSDIDLWALQEIADPAAWSTLLSDLQADGLQGMLGPVVSSDPDFDQRLAYVYDPAAVTIIATRTLPTSVVTAYNFGGRVPFEMLANITTNGVSRSVRIINFHAKASTGSSDYDRRLAGSIELKEYSDALISQGVSVIILGDMNDRLVTSTAGGRVSPYRNFSSDTQRYGIATRTLDETNTPTYCSNNACTSGSPIDHIFYASSLFTEYVADSGDRFDELVSAITNYRSSTSDHLPVIATFFIPNVATEVGSVSDGAIALLAPAPNPFRGRTAIRFTLDAPAQVRLDVLDALGRTVKSVEGGYGSGTQQIDLDGSALPSGVYVARIESGGTVRTQRIVRMR